MIIIGSIIIVAIVDAIILAKKGRNVLFGALYGIFSYIIAMAILGMAIKGIILAILSVVVSILATFIIKSK